MLVNAILFALEDIVGGGGGSVCGGGGSVWRGVAVGTTVGIAVAVGAVVGVGIGVSSAPQALTRSRVNRPNDTAETLNLSFNLTGRMHLPRRVRIHVLPDPGTQWWLRRETGF